MKTGLTPSTRRLGLFSTLATALLIVTYAVTLLWGLLSPNVDDRFQSARVAPGGMVHPLPVTTVLSAGSWIN